MRTKLLASAALFVAVVGGASVFGFARSRATTPPACRGGACCVEAEKSVANAECCVECLQCCALDGCCEECFECCLAMGCGDCFVSETTTKPTASADRSSQEFHADIAPATDSVSELNR